MEAVSVLNNEIELMATKIKELKELHQGCDIYEEKKDSLEFRKSVRKILNFLVGAGENRRLSAFAGRLHESDQ